MSHKEAKAIYEMLLDSGDLFDFYGNYTGDWKKDKKVFLKNYENNEKIINNK